MPKRKIGNTEVEYSDPEDNNNNPWIPIEEDNNDNPWIPIEQTSQPKDERGYLRKAWDASNTYLPGLLPKEGEELFNKAIEISPIGRANQLFDKYLKVAGVSPETREGISEGKKNLGKGLVTPLSLGTMGTGGLLTKAPLVGRTLAGAFGLTSAKGVYDSAREFLNTDDPKVKARAAVEGLGNLGFAGLAGAHAIKGGPVEVAKTTAETPLTREQLLAKEIEENRAKTDAFYEEPANEPLPRPWLSATEEGKYLIRNKEVDRIIEEKYLQLKWATQDIKRQFLIDKQEIASDTPQFNKFDEGISKVAEDNSIAEMAGEKITRPTGTIIDRPEGLSDPVIEDKIPQPLKSQAQIAADKAGITLQRPIVYPQEEQTALGKAMENNPLVEPDYKTIMRRPERDLNLDRRVNPVVESKLGVGGNEVNLVKPLSKPVDTSNLGKLPIKYQEQFPGQSMEGLGKNIPGEEEVKGLKPLKIIDKRKSTGGQVNSLLGGAGEALEHIKNTYKDLKDTFGDYVPSLMKEIGSGKPFGIQADKEGKVNPFSLKAKMMTRLSKPEQEMLKASGFDKWLENKGNNKVGLDEALGYLKENSPKIEVKKLEATPSSEETQRIAALEHKFDTIQSNWREMEPEDREAGWSSQAKKEYAEYRELLKNRGRREQNDSATANYTQVNPKPLDKMPGAVDILVRLPLKLSKELEARTKPGDDISHASDSELGIKYNASQHYPNEGENLIAHVRGYMETLPNGEKVFHVFEVQSDWAQEFGLDTNDKTVANWLTKDGQRQSKKFTTKEAAQAAWEEKYEEYKKANPEAALDYTNHLGLKAAIKHAVDNGASHIAISDANTAMLSERHDQHVNRYNEIKDVDSLLPELQKQFEEKYPDLAKKYELYSPKDTSTRQELAHEPFALVNKETGEHKLHFKTGTGDTFVSTGGKIILDSPKPFEWVEHVDDISQEKGMRLHYDQSLPNIARKLTGSEARRVDFGEHQNTLERAGAFGSNQEGYQQWLRNEMQPRKNLILKDNEGNPQTTIKANLFSLDKIKPRLESGEPYSIYGATYANPIVEIAKITGKTLASGVEKLFKYDPTRPEIDKVGDKLGATGKYIADTFKKFYDKLTSYQGSLVNNLESKLLDTLSFKERHLGLEANSPELTRAWQYLNDVMDKTPTSITLSPKEQLIVKAIRDNLVESGKIQLNKGIPVWTSKGPRSKMLDPDYVPQIFKEDIQNTLANKPGSLEYDKIRTAQINYWVNKKGLTPLNAKEHFDDIVRSYKATDTSNKGSQFGPVDKAAGLGIAPELREMNPLKAMSQYNRRMARRFSYFDAIESDPISRSALGVNTDVMGNPTPKGLKLPSGEDVQYIGAAENVAPILKDIEARHSISDLKWDAGMQTLGQSVMQAWSGLRDVTATQFLGWERQLPTQYIPAFVKGLANLSRGIAEGLDKGVIRHDMVSIEGLEGGVGDIVTNLQRLRGVVGKVSGRNLFERIARGTAFEQGKYLALDNIYQLSKGSSNMQRIKFMKDFAYDMNWKGRNNFTPEEVKTMAARYVKSVQNTYDYTGLPRTTQEGVGKYIFNWNRWNIEKKNNFIKNVVLPMKEGNYWPLVGATLGTMLGGEAILQLQQLVSGGRKDKAPTWKEIDNAEDRKGEALFYKLASLSDASGHAGILGSIAHNIAKQRFGGKTQEMLSNPVVESSIQVVQRAMQAIEALENGDKNVGLNLINQIAQDNIQNYRLIINQVDDTKARDIISANKNRDYKMFRELSGEHSSYKPTEVNPFLNQESREFKKDNDPSKAGELGIKAINAIVDRNKNNPVNMVSQLRGLKSNPITWMPSMEGNALEFAKYLSFVRRTQGESAANKLVNDYAMTKALNDAKGKMVPTIKMR